MSGLTAVALPIAAWNPPGLSRGSFGSFLQEASYFLLGCPGLAPGRLTVVATAKAKWNEVSSGPPGSSKRESPRDKPGASQTKLQLPPGYRHKRDAPRGKPGASL